MAETVEYAGIRWRRYPDSERLSDSRYFKATGHGYLHRRIWEDANGPIPDGFHVHHRDGDPSNNDLSNLEAVSPKQHLAEHWTPERAAASSKRMDEIRGKASEWHRSPEGRAWHRVHGEDVWKGREEQTAACEQCGKEYASLKPGRFCSNKCKSAFRRDSGVDDEKRNCDFCGEEFVINRYSRKRTCSSICAGRLQSRTKRGLQPSG